ncbi:MAG TPA: prolipoprotein diacylglyceryl transferase [Paenibacillaceae bacterium]|nr:prolipoprotein diacylglyceryl transferase [Paenibacillaceae bacterium]
MLTGVIDPVALRLGPIEIHWYGVIIGTAALIGLILALKEAEKQGFNKELILDLIMYAIPAALIGARAYYVIFRWNEYYSIYPGEIIAIWHGGLAIHGGLIGAFIAGIIFARVKKVSFWRIGDLLAPSIILGQAIGRWGNFMNQEAHGGPVSRTFLENLHLPNFIIEQMYIKNPLTGEYQYYHPTFLYESLWNMLGFITLLIFRRKLPVKRGDIFLTYLVWYSVGRFFVEGLRTDSLMLFGGLMRAAQVVSLVFIVVAVILFIVRRKKGYANERYGA